MQSVAGIFSAVCAFVCAIVTVAQSADAPKPSVEAAPDWVIPAEIPDVNPARIDHVANGAYVLVSDTQIRNTQQSRVHFYRHAAKITDRTGLESTALLSFVFDPSEHRLAVHTVRVHRDNAAEDRLDDLTFTLARRERGLPDGIETGLLTAYAQIPDVQVGDIVEYEVSWHQRPKFWPGEYFSTFAVEFQVPIGYFRHRILLPNDQRATITGTREPAPFERATGETHTEYSWALYDPAPVPAIAHTPYTYTNLNSVSVTTFESWGDISRWALPIYEADLELPEKARTVLEAIREQTSDTDEQITEVIRYVQDQIRYVGNEIGLGSHVPRPPREVIRLAYGDCKDKSVLLVAMLRALGVEAHAALVNRTNGYEIARHAPSPGSFNHVIVLIVQDGRRYWVDPTDTKRGGRFPDLVEPYYGFALPLQAGSTDLVEMRLPETDRETIVYTEHHDFASLADKGVFITVEGRFTGQDADLMRYRAGTHGMESLKKLFETYYQSLYPGIRFDGALELKDDRDGNRITTQARLVLPKENYSKDSLFTRYPLQADQLFGILPSVSTDEREAPIALFHPSHTKIIFILTDTPTKLWGEQNFTASEPYVDFSVRTESGERMVKITYALRTKSVDVPPSAFDRYSEIAKAVESHGRLNVNLGRPMPPAGRIVAILVMVALFGAAAAALYWGGRASLRYDASYEGPRVLYPISLTKFIVLSVSTLGIYHMFWLWKCWRWVRHNEKPAIWPLWRAVFSPIWLYTLFDAVRRRAGSGLKFVFVGAGLSLCYILWVVAWSITPGALALGPPMHVLALLMSVSSFVWIIPLVVMVNRQNAGHPEAIAHFSQWHLRTVLAVLIGLLLFLLVMIATIVGASA